MKRTLFICSGVLLLMHLLLFWLLPFLPVYVPLFGARYIYLHGVIFIGVQIVVIWYFLKRYHAEDPEASLSELTSIGLLAELCAQAIFQLVREYIEHEDPTGMKYIFEYFISVLVSAALAGIISYYIAGRLKQNGLTRLISLVLLIGLGLIYMYLRAHGNL